MFNAPRFCDLTHGFPQSPRVCVSWWVGVCDGYIAQVRSHGMGVLGQPKHVATPTQVLAALCVVTTGAPTTLATLMLCAAAIFFFRAVERNSILIAALRFVVVLLFYHF
jgi:hypothetical protein